MGLIGLTVVTVSGDSMAPALAQGDRLLIRRVRFRRLAVGDIVVARLPGIPADYRPGPRDRIWLIKRVAALPGDRAPDGERVPPGCLMLLSDNPAEENLDSRELGYFSGDLVLGRVVRRLG